jgi:hypothetical protein
MTVGDRQTHPAAELREGLGLRRWARITALGALVALGGAVLGVILAFATPAHVEIAGSDTRVWVEPGRDFDQFGVTGLVTLRRAAARSVVGEPFGVRAVLSLDASELVDDKGQFNPDVLPAYIQAYSDPDQLVSDIRHALVVHLIWFAVCGAVIAVLITGGGYAYLRWRASYDRAHWPAGEARALARRYRAPERSFAWRAAAMVAIVALLNVVPSSQRHAPAPTDVRGDALFASGPLAGVEVDGLLRPAIATAEDYIEKYFAQTNTYYDGVRDALIAQLEASPVLLPTGEDVAQLGFVTDRHCNTGMDRVDVALLKHFGITTLVSGGDDAFSGSFSFESACTRNLAEQSRAAGITDVFVGGNHDSPQTIEDERHQRIKTLTGKVVLVDGLNFLGLPDPRTSRYGDGIQPSSADAQRALVGEQARAVANTACAADGPIIAVLHDPRAGYDALAQGCGKVTLALTGHTHTQSGPNPVTLLDGTTGYQFTGASSGGAPSEHSIATTFASRLTVGPLNHDAAVEIVSVERGTGRLIGVTEFRFTPDGQIVVTQQVVP